MTRTAQSREDKFPIGMLAKRSGANIETIRYYERIGLLRAPARTSSGRRVYGHDDLRALVFIRRSRDLGFTLEDVRTLLRLGGPARASCGDVRTIAARHLEGVRAKLADLSKLEKVLASTVSQCSGADVAECPVLDVLDIDRAGAPA